MGYRCRVSNCMPPGLKYRIFMAFLIVVKEAAEWAVIPDCRKREGEPHGHAAGGNSMMIRLRPRRFVVFPKPIAYLPVVHSFAGTSVTRFARHTPT